MALCPFSRQPGEHRGATQTRQGEVNDSTCLNDEAFNDFAQTVFMADTMKSHEGTLHCLPANGSSPLFLVQMSNSYTVRVVTSANSSSVCTRGLTEHNFAYTSRYKPFREDEFSVPCQSRRFLK
ncbi:hypothetical protein EYF80_024946 [Liparis tanakae]|uniref:Uncharacterized protein n=1 Tax=Liparis tanakae TaxID=230148 RepID=A0A4Z2HHW1_9TELE|nr:hypothetical protein EYF80_024946 [Liparis tanakae]